jgi:hypothetical protein
LPGYTFSGDPPLDRDFGLDDVAYLVNTLMVQLEYKNYIAQGGDLGAFIGRLLGANYSDNCKGTDFLIHKGSSKLALGHIRLETPPKATFTLFLGMPCLMNILVFL